MYNQLCLFLYDRENNRPARNVRVESFASIQSSQKFDAILEEPSGAQLISLGLFQSDHVGYVSFDLTSATESGTITQLTVRPVAQPEQSYFTPAHRNKETQVELLAPGQEYSSWVRM